MKHFTTLLKNAAYVIATVALLFLSDVSFGQKKQSPLAGPLRPNLGTASTYAVFTGAGAINNTGASQLDGDVGQDGAYAFNGFPPGTYTGTLNRNNGASALAKADLLTAWTTNAATPCDIVLGAGITDGQSFNPAVYCSGAASTTSGNITFDAHGDGNAIFIVNIGGQLDANSGTHILLANGAKPTNIYWFVDGAVNIADNSSFKGVIFARGAITFNGTSSLEGRALVAPGGAITLAANIIMPVFTSPGNNITVLSPAKGDTLKGGTQNYQITWSGSGINSKKIFEYSLDNGLTWKVIDTISADVFSHNWNVPDTNSSFALVRITDGKLSGTSGVFTISSSKSPGGIVILRPALGEIVAGGTQNYQIMWSGTGIASKKTLEYSLDGGATWNLIKEITTDEQSFSWNVPDTSSKQAVVRITDGNGKTGSSGLFTIMPRKPNPGSIVITHPILGEVVDGGTQNFMINFTAVNTAAQKTLEYSLDGGASWSLIGFLNTDAQSFVWGSVPNIATTQALVRITDANGVSGTSGLFTINAVAGVGSINSITLTGLDNNRNIGNNQSLGISWTFTPDIGTSVEVEYSLDYTQTWLHIATVQVSESPSTSWMTVSLQSAYYNPVFVRVTSSKGMTRTSAPFSIGTNASVTSNASKNGYSVSNYPNPATSLTTINFVLPVASEVTLTIIDGLGREVKVLSPKHYEAGSYNIPIETSTFSAGMYTYVLQAGTTKILSKMSIIK